MLWLITERSDLTIFEKNSQICLFLMKNRHKNRHKNSQICLFLIKTVTKTVRYDGKWSQKWSQKRSDLTIFDENRHKNRQIWRKMVTKFLKHTRKRQEIFWIARNVGRYILREVLSARWFISVQSVAVYWSCQFKLVQGIGMIISNRLYDSITFLQKNRKKHSISLRIKIFLLTLHPERKTWGVDVYG